jgi:hypothetical protein
VQGAVVRGLRLSYSNTLELCHLQRVSNAAVHLTHYDQVEQVNLMGTPSNGRSKFSSVSQTSALLSRDSVTDTGTALLQQLQSFKAWQGGKDAMPLMSFSLPSKLTGGSALYVLQLKRTRTVGLVYSTYLSRR